VRKLRVLDNLLHRVQEKKGPRKGRNNRQFVFSGKRGITGGKSGLKWLQEEGEKGQTIFGKFFKQGESIFYLGLKKKGGK